MHIQEMAKRLQITPRAIRFYEEKGLIKPAKEASSGYRQFTEEDAWRLQTIIALREVGMPIEEIRQLLDKLDKEEGTLLSYLEIQRSYMYDRWVELKTAIQTTETMIARLKQDSRLDPASLYELAEANKRLRQTRKNWVDRWNFNQLAPIYDELVAREGQGFHAHDGYERVLDQVVDYIRPAAGEIGLDAGTGTGNLVKRFRERGIKMCAIDQSSEMLKRCRAKNPGVETKLGTFFAIPYMDHTFDFVVSSYALHHLTDEQKCLALAEFHRVLKPGGRMAVADLMFVDDEQRAAHIRALRKAGDVSAVEAIEDEYYGNRTVLLDELARLGFRAEARQLNTYVHLLGCILP
ncbi:methyltransferase domain-containing protein [Brevibacillus sp. SYP-B805]|uniref:methyltransferase domain-containing protein n=1 Tax=Brevibacillus sp. SYP-B805 TaxID=1578199 RepID=UPI0013ECF729|nr:methyltransferase domain-containing protein [Brevibacillus sp. SYP-B805]NGQ94761.1 methyltransferase domain-containing protein [Brevibacillus sp. SYP-B805]